MKEAKTFRLVLVTAASEEEAAKIGRALVEGGLAACVNIIPRVRSIYRWEGEIQDDRESLLFIKTAAVHLEEISARVAELHSYEVPEVIALPLDRGRDSYLTWLAECCSVPPGGEGSAG